MRITRCIHINKIISFRKWPNKNCLVCQFPIESRYFYSLLRNKRREKNCVRDKLSSIGRQVNAYVQ